METQKEQAQMKHGLSSLLALVVMGSLALGMGMPRTRAAAHAGDVDTGAYGAATLAAVGGSMTSGAVAIYRQAGGVVVAVSLSGLKPKSVHPEHIHAGACGSNGPVKFPLPNLVADAKGTAVAVISIKASSVPKSGWYVNVHSSAQDLSVIACGAVHQVGMDMDLKATGKGKGSGFGLLTKTSKGTEVIVYVTHLGMAGVHPEHLHAGACGSNGPVKFPLPNLVTNSKGDGVSATMIKGSVPMTGLYINVHTSPSDLSVVACGNLGGKSTSGG